MLQGGCYKGVKGVLQGCYMGITKVILGGFILLHTFAYSCIHLHNVAPCHVSLSLALALALALQSPLSKIKYNLYTNHMATFTQGGECQPPNGFRCYTLLE